MPEHADDDAPDDLEAGWERGEPVELVVNLRTCCHYEDHHPGPCPCPLHRKSAVHPNGGAHNKEDRKSSDA